MIIPYGKHIRTVISHKIAVYRAGRRLGLPRWHLVNHDMSKFSATEMYGYALFFYADVPRSKSKPVFDLAWKHHWQKNPHHWQHWCTENADGSFSDPKPMPERFAMEMVADWMGASYAYDGAWPTGRETWKWLQENYYGGRLVIAPLTRLYIEEALDILFDVPTTFIELTKRVERIDWDVRAKSMLDDEVVRVLATQPQEVTVSASDHGLLTLKLDGLGYWYGTLNGKRIDVRREEGGWMAHVNGQILIASPFDSREAAVEACIGAVFAEPIVAELTAESKL